MSVRNTIKIITLAGAATMLPGVASAGDPTFGNWDVSAGSIDVEGNCPSGWTCSVTNSGDGFAQATVTDGTDTYVQTIITDSSATCDPNVTGDCAFVDENFVKTDGTSSGIAARQIANDSASNFTNDVTINTGWALGSGPNVDINQTLSDDPDGTPNSNDEFATAFNLQVNLDASGNQTGLTMAVSQDVGLGVGGTDSQTFEVREASGDLQSTPGSAVLNSNTISWADTDDVLVTWISQDVDIGSSGSSVFAFQSVENKTTDPGAPVSDFSTSVNDPTAAPFDWGSTSDVKATFGAAPGCPGLADC